jgi:hypothetical protein
MTASERSIGEAITPVLTDAADRGRMGFGEPALPGKFRWRGRSVTIATVDRWLHA